MFVRTLLQHGRGRRVIRAPRSTEREGERDAFSEIEMASAAAAERLFLACGAAAPLPGPLVLGAAADRAAARGAKV